MLSQCLDGAVQNICVSACLAWEGVSSRPWSKPCQVLGRPRHGTAETAALLQPLVCKAAALPPPPAREHLWCERFTSCRALQLSLIITCKLRLNHRIKCSLNTALKRKLKNDDWLVHYGLSLDTLLLQLQVSQLKKCPIFCPKLHLLDFIFCMRSNRRSLFACSFINYVL